MKLKAEGRIVTAPADPGVLERSLADVSVLAGLLIDKFRFHLPLYCYAKWRSVKPCPGNRGRYKQSWGGSRFG